MADDQPQFIEVGEGASRRRIAALIEPREGRPGVLWLIGLKSDMVSTKAVAVAEWARRRGVSSARFDYSGHGRSERRFEEATIGDWLEEAVAVFTRLTRGPQIVLGSSTGGHIALLLLRRLIERHPDEARRLKALILIAPAWDLTEELMWKKFPPEARRALMESGVYHEPSEYGEPFALTRRFIEEGRDHLFARRPFDPGRPVHILQGLQDTSVPPEHVRELAHFLTGGWVDLVEVPDGDHRLSRPQDIALLEATLDAAAGACRDA